MPDAETVDKIIESLEYISRRPGMYLGEEKLSLAIAYLHGFYHAFIVLGRLQDGQGSDVRLAVTRERGWDIGGAEGWPERDMRKHGLTERQMIDEVFAIHVEAWRRVAAQIAADSPH